jgi:hypothetical protein
MPAINLFFCNSDSIDQPQAKRELQKEKNLWQRKLQRFGECKKKENAKVKPGVSS